MTSIPSTNPRRLPLPAKIPPWKPPRRKPAPVPPELIELVTRPDPPVYPTVTRALVYDASFIARITCTLVLFFHTVGVTIKNTFSKDVSISSLLISIIAIGEALIATYLVILVVAIHLALDVIKYAVLLTLNCAVSVAGGISYLLMTAFDFVWDSILAWIGD